MNVMIWPTILFPSFTSVSCNKLRAKNELVVNCEYPYQESLSCSWRNDEQYKTVEKIIRAWVALTQQLNKYRRNLLIFSLYCRRSETCSSRRSCALLCRCRCCLLLWVFEQKNETHNPLSCPIFHLQMARICSSCSLQISFRLTQPPLILCRESSPFKKLHKQRREERER